MRPCDLPIILIISISNTFFQLPYFLTQAATFLYSTAHVRVCVLYSICLYTVCIYVYMCACVYCVCVYVNNGMKTNEYEQKLRKKWNRVITCRTSLTKMNIQVCGYCTVFIQVGYSIIYCLLHTAKKCSRV